MWVVVAEQLDKRRLRGDLDDVVGVGRVVERGEDFQWEINSGVLEVGELVAALREQGNVKVREDDR